MCDYDGSTLTIVYKVVGSWGYAKTLRGKAGFVTAKNLKGL